MKKENIKLRCVNEEQLSIISNVVAEFYPNYINSNSQFFIGCKWIVFEKDSLVTASDSRIDIGDKTLITLKQLIELLVSEQEPAEKIAVLVDNEKEFNALMKYYDSLGWKCASGAKSLAIEYCLSNRYIYYHDNFLLISTPLSSEEEGYKIIPFSEFAKEHGIRVPLLVSEDGVELFEGDKYTCVYKHCGIWFKGEDNLTLNNTCACLSAPEGSKAFYNRQAALDWIEAQKPKDVKLQIGCVECTITKNAISFNRGVQFLIADSVKSIHKAMEELNS